MQRNRNRRLALLGILALVLGVTSGLGICDLAAAKKKKNRNPGGTVDIAKPVNAQIPDATGAGFSVNSGAVTSTIEVTAARPFIGTLVRDVNVTMQTTGNGPPDSSTDNGGSVSNLRAYLTAPNGTTAWLFGGLYGQSLGPLTFDDQTPVVPTFLPPPAPDSTTLAPPYAGTAQPFCYFSFGACPLAVLNNVPATGIWTLTVVDVSHAFPANTSRLDSWRLNLVAGRPYKTKRK